ncbi:MmpS family transport accessory protein [Flavobacterium hercynium]|uniref:Lipocalin-like domain-containing protein n=1 Tax=Flavobacterium hercynium TaxID=387094 RepID=A0A226HDH8_9FLAO|nr:MmpS family transport accessory protein [Flavobacterium hercynium]OXA91691.1 hypothetical protein B0A66_11160 [Flavobacterium hercynium]SMP27458.1 membrane protein [Flavobacterium hercynium]
MKSIFKTLAIALTLAFTAVSCSSDNDNGSGSRDVKYEITGNYKGKLGATYMESGNAGQNVDVTTLPWTKEFKASGDTTGAGITVSGNGGAENETITVKIYVGGKVVKETTAKATSDGIIIAIPGTYIF